MTLIDNLKNLLEKGQETALLQYSLGNAYLNESEFEPAAKHLARAVTLDPDYSAAWKLYGKALVKLDKKSDATEAYEKGIAVAEKKGDVQAAKEMRVFLKRLEQ